MIPWLQIASTTSQVDNNLDSKTISCVLNSFLYKSLSPIFFNTNMVEIILASLLNICYSDHRRKISALPKPEMIVILFKVIILEDKEEKWELVQKLQLERTIYYDIIQLFLKLTNQYLNHEHYLIKTNKIFYSNEMAKIENKLGISRAHCAPTIRWAQCYIKYYDEFKNSIINKYIRLAAQEAKKSTFNTNLKIDDEELFKNLILSMQKAIAKFNPNKGTLTSYIKWWFMDAKTNPEFDHKYNESYSITNTERRHIRDKKDYTNVNLSQSLDTNKNTELSNDSLNIEDMLINKEQSDIFYKLISQIRNTKYLHLIFDIPYVIPQAELEEFKQQ